MTPFRQQLSISCLPFVDSAGECLTDQISQLSVSHPTPGITKNCKMLQINVSTDQYNSTTESIHQMQVEARNMNHYRG